jgi:hypothetical protein
MTDSHPVPCQQQPTRSNRACRTGRDQGSTAPRKRVQQDKLVCCFLQDTRQHASILHHSRCRLLFAMVRQRSDLGKPFDVIPSKKTSYLQTSPVLPHAHSGLHRHHFPRNTNTRQRHPYHLEPRNLDRLLASRQQVQTSHHVPHLDRLHACVLYRVDCVAVDI